MQDDYGNMRAGVVGQVSNMVPSTRISRTVETAAIPFGVAVSQGTEDGGIVAYTDNVVGITVRDRSVAAGQDDYQVGDSAALLTEGTIFVNAEVAVAAGEAVHVIAGGLFSNTDGTALPNARWDTSTSGTDQLAVIRIG